MRVCANIKCAVRRSNKCIWCCDDIITRGNTQPFTRALSQLKKLPKFLARRKNLAAKYDAVFSDQEALVQPAQKRNKQVSAHHLYVINIDFAKLGYSRAEVMELLKVRGIGTQVHYVPVYRQPYYRELLCACFTNYPMTEVYYAGALSIPLYAAMSDADQGAVITSLKEIGCI